MTASFRTALLGVLSTTACGTNLTALRLAGNHFLDARERPVDFLPRDDQRRCDTDYVVMSFLTENSQFLKRLAIRTCGTVAVRLRSTGRLRGLL